MEWLWCDYEWIHNNVDGHDHCLHQNFSWVTKKNKTIINYKKPLDKKSYSHFPHNIVTCIMITTGFGLVIGFISRLQLHTVTHNYLQHFLLYNFQGSSIDYN
jgi:hypothetical protein